MKFTILENRDDWLEKLFLTALCSLSPEKQEKIRADYKANKGVEFVLMINDIEVPIQPIIEEWISGYDSEIAEKAEKLLEEKLNTTINAVYDSLDHIKDQCKIMLKRHGDGRYLCDKCGEMHHEWDKYPHRGEE